MDNTEVKGWSSENGKVYRSGADYKGTCGSGTGEAEGTEARRCVWYRR